MTLVHDIIIKPHVTEKSTNDAAAGRYTFVVAKTASKPQIREACEKLFDVKVTSVNIVNYSGKLKRQRYVEGRTPSWKKAVVTIDMDPQAETYQTKGGKTSQTGRKYKTSIEEFGFGQ